MQFSEPRMLWGLLLLAIPIAVHLLSLRRYKKVYFSNVDQLTGIRSQSQRHRNLRRRLVLAMRCLAVAMLVLAFARPVIPHKDGDPRQGGTAVSIYVDNTFSAENTAGDEGSMLDVAKRTASEIAEAYNIDDRFHLMTADMSGSEMRWLSRDELLTAIDEIRPSAASPMLSDVVARQRDFIRQSSARNHHAYVVSDMQRSVSDLTHIEADTTMRLSLVPLRCERTDNVFVDTLVLDAPAYYVGGVASVVATVRNDGQHDMEHLPVRMYINGSERAIATVDIPASSTAKVTLGYTVSDTGWIDGMVTVDDYPVTFDDRWYFTMHAGDCVRVYEMGGGQGADAIAKLFAADSLMRYRYGSQLPRLDEVDFLVLNGVQRLTSGESQQIASWVGEGGAVLVVPAADAATDELNGLLAAMSMPQLMAWKERTALANSIDYDNPLFRSVFAQRSDDMEMPSVYGYYPTYAAMSRQVIGLPGGDNLLASNAYGLGTAYLLTVPIDSRWTDFASRALFVPTIYNMALFSRPLPTVSHVLGSSEPVALRGDYRSMATPPEMSDGETKLIPDVQLVGGRWRLVQHGELGKSGIYTVGDEHIAFNYSRRESHLECLSDGDIDKMIDGKVGISLLRTATESVAAAISRRDGGRQLWQMCLILALVALAAETLVIKLTK